MIKEHKFRIRNDGNGGPPKQPPNVYEEKN